MDWIGIWVLVGIFALIAPIVLFFIVSGQGERLRRLEMENRVLGGHLASLQQLYEALLASRHATPQPAAAAPAPAVLQTPAETPPPSDDVAGGEARDIEAEGASEQGPGASPQADDLAPEIGPPPPSDGDGRARAAAKPVDWERLIGVRLPVWLGAIALAFAGFFLVRYSIEMGFFGPEARVFAGLVAGALLLGGAELVLRRVRTNAVPIAGALGAASVATFYGAVYAASTLYQLVPEAFGFAAMALVTAGGVSIALRYGQVVMFVGLLGGYVTPALFGSDEPSAFILFAYLTALLVGLFAVIRVKGWWRLAWPALLGPLLWVLIWGASPALMEQHFFASAFVLAVPVVVMAAALEHWGIDRQAVTLFRRAGRPYDSPLHAGGFAVLLAAFGFFYFVWASGFALPFWQSHAIFALLCVTLTVIWPVALRYVLLPPLVSSLLALLLWPEPPAAMFATIGGGLFVLFAGGAFLQFQRLREPFLWALVMSLVALGFFLTLLFKLDGWAGALENEHLWALGAAALASAFVALLWRYGPAVDEKQRESVYATFAATASAFLSLVLVLELNPILFPAAAAVQVFGLAAVWTRVPVGGLRHVAAGYAVLYGLLIFSRSGGGQLEGLGLFAQFLDWTVADDPLVLLVVPGIALLAAATLFRRSGDVMLPDWLDGTGAAVLAVGAALWVAPNAASAPWSQVHQVAALLFNAELGLAAVLAVWAGFTGRRVLYLGAAMIGGLVAIAMLAGLILPVIEFWPRLEIPGPAMFNPLLASLGTSSLLLAGLGWYIRRDGVAAIHWGAVVASIIAVLGLFTMLLLMVRHAFHPLDLQGATGATEYYLYSIVTLAYGLVLLAIGTAIRNIGARILSFLFLLAAVAKVFLFDAAALEGLWRVLSFVGLGLSLLAISWFYARFVFGLTGRMPPKSGVAA